MATQKENKSLDWLMAPSSQSGLDPLLEAMKQRGTDVVTLDEALPVLVKSPKLQTRLRQKFGLQKGNQMLSMMRSGAFSGDAGDELHDYLADAILNSRNIVWSGLIKGGDGDDDEDYPVQVTEYCGIYYVWGVEGENVGYFLDMDSAKSYVYLSWGDVVDD